jgi:hypothetical protein
MSVPAREALVSIAVYAKRQAEHHETDGLGEARAWRHVAFAAERGLAGIADPVDSRAELLAVLQTVRRRLRSHVPPDEVARYIDEELDHLTLGDDPAED